MLPNLAHTATPILPGRQKRLPTSRSSSTNTILRIARFPANSSSPGTAAIPSTSREDFYSLTSVLPPEALQSLFDNIVCVIYDKKTKNDSLTAGLTKLRDTLLPKLISGELRIPDAEKLAEAALV